MLPNVVQGFHKSVAIIVAIDKYVDGVPELSTPVADALALKDVLHDKHGFEVELLLDQAATLDGLRDLLKELPKRICSDDRVFFYFAGHGTALPSDDGPEGYLLTQDASASSSDRYLSMRELNTSLAALSCRHMLVVLDCCFAGALRWSSTRDLVLSPGNLHQERYEWFVRDPAWLAIASAAHDEKAMDIAAGRPLGERGSETGHSPFARALIEGLSGEADLHFGRAGDGVITATELFIYLRNSFLPVPGSTRPRQTPVFWPLTKHRKGEFVFLVPNHELNLPPAPRLDFSANPWLGLETYDRSQSELFFGRKDVTDQLSERILRDPLVVATGPSGIGKSSLVRAGVLRRLGELPIVPIVVRPGPAPFEALAEALQAVDADKAGSPTAAKLKLDHLALANFFSADARRGVQYLLFIDQLEELVTQNRDRTIATDFLAAIAKALDRAPSSTDQQLFTATHARLALQALGYSDIAALNQLSKGCWEATARRNDKTAHVVLQLPEMPLRVALTVRSEFEPQFATSPLSDRWDAARALIPRMTQDELRRVVEGPAATRVLRFESAALVDKLVNDVVETPGALPVLSFALSEMYKSHIRRQAEDRTISELDYANLGGGVTGALRARADEIANVGDKAVQETTRRVLERFVSVETGAFARRRVPKREFEVDNPAEARRVSEVLERFEAARLVISDKIGHEPYAELAHDALILGWNKLLDWIREDFERVVSLRRLSADADSWSTAQSPGLLWDDAERIPHVLDLLKSPFPGLTKSEADFANASVRRNRRNRLIRWGTTAALCLLTSGAIWFAYLTEAQRQISESGRLAASAQLASALDQSLLLSASAASIHPGFEARSALFASLSRRPLLSHFLSGAQDSLDQVSFLPNGNLLGLSHGAILVWETNSAKAKPRLLDRFGANIDDFVWIWQRQMIAVRRGNSVTFFKVDPLLQNVDLVRTFEVEGLTYISGSANEDLVFALSEDGRISAFSAEKEKPVWTASLPSRDNEEVSIVGSGNSLFVKTKNGIWRRAANKWQQLRGPPPEGFVYLSLWTDERGERVVSALATGQNEDPARKLAKGELAFRCWQAASGASSMDCPDLPPLAGVSTLGFADANTALYSTSDQATGQQRADYRQKLDGSWTQETLRLDPRWVTGLALSSNKMDIAVATVDGELGLYTTQRFLSGEARDFKTGKPLFASWDEQGCRVVLLRVGRMDATTCTLDGITRTVPVDSRWLVPPRETKNRTAIYAVTDPTRIVVWDDNLNQIVELPCPEGRRFSVAMDLIFDAGRREISVVIDHDNALLTFSIDGRRWRTSATLPFSIGSLVALPDGTAVVGSKDGAEIIALEIGSGGEKFRTSIPGSDSVRLFSSKARDVLYAAGVVRQHGVFRIDAQTGRLSSANFNRFSGPAHLLAASPDGKHLVLEGVGIPDGRAGKYSKAGGGFGLELWDAERLMPLGEGVRTQDYDREVVAFSPDQSKLVLALTSPPRIVILPLGVSDWMSSACRMAGRTLDAAERARYSVQENGACEERPSSAPDESGTAYFTWPAL